MPTRNVVLTDRQEAMIEELVGAGRYQNASEVLREGLRLIERREAEDAAKLEALREAARIGMAAIAHDGGKRFGVAGTLDDYLDILAAEAIADPDGDCPP